MLTWLDVVPVIDVNLPSSDELAAYRLVHTPAVAKSPTDGCGRIVTCAAGVGVGVGVGVGAGVTGGDGMKLIPPPPPPQALSANAPALASKRLENCETVMAALRRWIGAVRRIGLPDV